MKKRGLGRGLAALIPEADPELDSASDEVLALELNRIEARRDQPRKDFDEESLDQLTKSVAEHGVLQPILVTKKGDNYEIVAGERRYRAAKAANLETIPAIVKEYDEKRTRQIALIENIQREDLNPIEEGRAYCELMKDYSLTQQELSETVGKSRSYIANTVRLLNLDEDSLDALMRGELTSSQGRALLSVDDLKERAILREKLLAKETNVAEVEKAGRRRNRRTATKDPYVADLEERFTEGFGTKVRLRPKKNGGSLVIEYYDAEDLERILRMVER